MKVSYMVSAAKPIISYINLSGASPMVDLLEKFVMACGQKDMHQLKKYIHPITDEMGL